MSIDNTADLRQHLAENVGSPMTVRGISLDLGITENHTRQLLHRLRQRRAITMRSTRGPRAHLVVTACN